MQGIYEKRFDNEGQIEDRRHKTIKDKDAIKEKNTIEGKDTQNQSVLKVKKRKY